MLSHVSAESCLPVSSGCALQRALPSVRRSLSCVMPRHASCCVAVVARVAARSDMPSHSMLLALSSPYPSAHTPCCCCCCSCCVVAAVHCVLLPLCSHVCTPLAVLIRCHAVSSVRVASHVTIPPDPTPASMLHCIPSLHCFPCCFHFVAIAQRRIVSTAPAPSAMARIKRVVVWRRVKQRFNPLRPEKYGMRELVAFVHYGDASRAVRAGTAAASALRVAVYAEAAARRLAVPAASAPEGTTAVTMPVSVNTA